MKFRMVVTKIDTEISIVTLGSICLLIAEFVKANNITSDVSLFTLSGFCLILSGVILIYRETVLKADILPTIEKEERGEILGHDDRLRIGRLGITNIFANTLFDIGIFFLTVGTFSILLYESIGSSLIKENLEILIIIVFIAFIKNFFNRRFFAK